MALNLEYVKGSDVRNPSSNKYQHYGIAFRCCGIIKRSTDREECKMPIYELDYGKEVDFSRKMAKVVTKAQEELPEDVSSKLFCGTNILVDYSCFEKEQIILMVVYDNWDEQYSLKKKGLDLAKKTLTPIIKDVFGEKYRLMAMFANNKYRMWIPKYYLINKSGHKELAAELHDHVFRYYKGKWHKTKDQDYISNYLFGIDPTQPESLENFGNQEIQDMIRELSKKEAEVFLNGKIDEDWFYDEFLKSYEKEEYL